MIDSDSEDSRRDENRNIGRENEIVGRGISGRESENRIVGRESKSKRERDGTRSNTNINKIYIDTNINNTNDQVEGTDLVREKLKVKPKKKPQKVQKKKEEIERTALEIVNDMKGFYKQDEILRSQQETLRSQQEASRSQQSPGSTKLENPGSIKVESPGSTKLENVDQLCERIMKAEIQEACIKFGVLNEIRIWLEPSAEGMLPSQGLKRKLLNLLQSLKIRKIDLLESQVGKIIHFYSKNGRESQEIRRMSRGLIDKWKKVVMEDCEEEECEL